MASKLDFNQQPTKDVVLQNETGFFDNVWAYFLHDYDNIEDDKFSIVSNEDTLSDDGYETLEIESLIAKAKNTKGYNKSEEELKKSLLIASLKRSSELLALSKRLNASEKNSVDKRATIIDRGMTSSRKCTDWSPEDRECKLQDDFDTYAIREGPPEIIYIGAEDRIGGKGIGNVNDRKVNHLSKSMIRRGIELDINQKSVAYMEKGASAQTIRTFESRKTDDTKAIKKRELLRRIALLRIKAAKARTARDN